MARSRIHEGVVTGKRWREGPGTRRSVFLARDLRVSGDLVSLSFRVNDCYSQYNDMASSLSNGGAEASMIPVTNSIS